LEDLLYFGLAINQQRLKDNKKRQNTYQWQSVGASTITTLYNQDGIDMLGLTMPVEWSDIS